MTQEAQHELNRFFLRYERDPRAARQLNKLTAFAVPQDSDHVFRGLLNKLDQAEGRLAAERAAARPDPQSGLL